MTRTLMLGKFCTDARKFVIANRHGGQQTDFFAWSCRKGLASACGEQKSTSRASRLSDGLVEEEEESDEGVSASLPRIRIRKSLRHNSAAV